jgi:hypothetical protein
MQGMSKRGVWVVMLGVLLGISGAQARTEEAPGERAADTSAAATAAKASTRKQEALESATGKIISVLVTGKTQQVLLREDKTNKLLEFRTDKGSKVDVDDDLMNERVRITYQPMKAFAGYLRELTFVGRGSDQPE